MWISRKQWRQLERRVEVLEAKQTVYLMPKAPELGAPFAAQSQWWATIPSEFSVCDLLYAIAHRLGAHATAEVKSAITFDDAKPKK